MASATKDPRKIAFVISPIGSPGTENHRRYQLALEYIVKKALSPSEWLVIRADDEESPDSIGAKVIERIIKSDLIIANLTDLNPNVFYELAVAHGFRKPVVHMIEDGQTIPFDVSDQRAIFYDLTDPESVHNATARLSASAQYLEGSGAEARNPLSQFAAFEAISSASSPGEAGTAVAEALQDLSLQVVRLARRIDEVESSRTIRRVVEPTHFGLRDDGLNTMNRLAQIEASIARLEAAEAQSDVQVAAKLAVLREEAARLRTRAVRISKESQGGRPRRPAPKSETTIVEG